ncbi:helix-turn-helix domain-containing protein [Motiliproteus sediminis]|uniref:helix-turn-helix domain-containing protein n=1 Tax=Motiliproteus sediminis TaxID=1468178 RepID=UPI001AEFD74B|nr:AraC family transcriptional regulator [Motiliproteus sediminis]
MTLNARLYQMPADSDRHKHAHHQLVVGVRGRAEFEINGSGDKLSTLRGCLAPADDAHYFQGQGDNAMLIVDLLTATPQLSLPPFEQDSFERLFQRASFFDVDPALQQLLQFSAEELKRTHNDPLLQQHLSATILHALGHRLGVTPQPPAQDRTLPLERIDRYITDNLDIKISVNHLAALVHLSSSHFHALFKQQTGLAPHQYLLRARLHKAVQLLRTSAVPLVEISQRCGFSSQSALTHALKKHAAMTPGQIRRAPHAPQF